MKSPNFLLKSNNLYSKKKLGQNFLTNFEFANKIITLSNLKKTDTVLEIGSGLGSLTFPLSKAVKNVYAVEKDQNLIEILKSELNKNEIFNISYINEDILKLDLTDFAKNLNHQFIVMGNLPYNISSQILVKLIKSRKYITKAVVMLQTELCQRIIANPGCKDFSRLSVMLQYCSNVKKILNVSAANFYPKPKVDSCILEFVFTDKYSKDLHCEEFFFKFVKAAFSKKRKNIKNSLANSELKFDTSNIKKILDDSSIDQKRRAETLSINEFIKLSNNFYDYYKTHLI